MASINYTTCIINNSTPSVISVAIYATVGSLGSVFIIISNLLILVSVIRFSHLRLTSNILIANLAVADLLVGVVLIPVNVASILDPMFTETKYGCTVKVFNWIFILGSAILGLFIISIDRLTAITAPLTYKTTNTRPIAVTACLITWLFWLLTSTLSFFVFNIWDCSKLCTVANVIEKAAFQFIAFTLGIPFLFSCVSFLIILRKLSRFDKSNVTRGNKDMKRRTTLMAMVFGLFVLFLIPLIISAVYASSVNVISNRILIEWLILLGGMNSAVNGFIYGVKRPEFRKAYLAIIFCKTGNRVQPVQTTMHVSTVSRRSDQLATTGTSA
ncbi:hypothetical protein SNE40_012610 [Patella caerulea]|uniref:G-protein coupled receptors family 1 profile domain-containing protein n=1 Tax=Patella caerulea TaxID=87958 RepID=A0AAN8JPU9_PATCE